MILWRFCLQPFSVIAVYFSLLSFSQSCKEPCSFIAVASHHAVTGNAVTSLAGYTRILYTNRSESLIMCSRSGFFGIWFVFTVGALGIIILFTITPQRYRSSTVNANVLKLLRNTFFVWSSHINLNDILKFNPTRKWHTRVACSVSLSVFLSSLGHIYLPPLIHQIYLLYTQIIW